MYDNISDDNSESDVSDDSEKVQNIINIFVLKFSDIIFLPLKKYEKIRANGDIHLTCINNEKLMLYGKKIYL